MSEHMPALTTEAATALGLDPDSAAAERLSRVMVGWTNATATIRDVAEAFRAIGEAWATIPPLLQQMEPVPGVTGVWWGDVGAERVRDTTQADIVATIDATIDAYERAHGPGSLADTLMDESYPPQRIGNVGDDPCGWRTT